MSKSPKILTMVELQLEVQRMMNQPFISDKEYYQFSLFADENQKFHYSVTSAWTTDFQNNSIGEHREPVLINPLETISFYKKIGEPVLVINDEKDFKIFVFFVGGNSIIESRLAKKFLPHIFKPFNSEFIYGKGFINSESIPEEHFNRAAAPKLRMHILKRDNRKCRVCGASPLNNEHVELHLHHILPYAEGGLTHEDNLITLCHTCHKGLEPHTDFSLFEYLGIDIIPKDSMSYNEKLKRNVTAMHHEFLKRKEKLRKEKGKKLKKS